MQADKSCSVTAYLLLIEATKRASIMISSFLPTKDKEKLSLSKPLSKAQKTFLPLLIRDPPIRDRVSFQKPTNHGIGAAI
jgi:hypothetical protein